MLDKLGGVFVSIIHSYLKDSLFLLHKIICICIFLLKKIEIMPVNDMWNYRHLVQAVVHTSCVSACLLLCSCAIVWSMLSRTMKSRRSSTKDWWKLTAKCERIRRILLALWVCTFRFFSNLLSFIMNRVKCHHGSVWSWYNLHVVWGMMCRVNWWRFITLFK